MLIGPLRRAHGPFHRHVMGSFRRRGVNVLAVLTDNGPEYIASGFRAALAADGLTHHRIQPRSPNHNVVRERLQGTASSWPGWATR